MRKALLLVTFFSLPVFAQDAKVRAEALFQEAKDLMARGEYDKACPKLARSQKLDPATGTLLNLASCYEHEGKFASAWAAYKEAAAASLAAGRTDREKLAREKAAELEPKLPYVTVSVSKVVPGLKIDLDGNALDSAEWGTRLPVDPGKHRVQANAPGYAGWEATFETTQAEKQDVTVPALKASSSSTPTDHVEPPLVVQPIPESAPKKKGPWVGIGIGTAVAGVGGIVIGSVLGIMALDTKSQLDGACGPMRACGPEQQGRIDELGGRATGSTIAFIAGGVLLAAGITMVIVPLAGSSKTVSIRGAGFVF